MRRNWVSRGVVGFLPAAVGVAVALPSLVAASPAAAVEATRAADDPGTDPVMSTPLRTTSVPAVARGEATGSRFARALQVLHAIAKGGR